NPAAYAGAARWLQFRSVSYCASSMRRPRARLVRSHWSSSASLPTSVLINATPANVVASVSTTAVRTHAGAATTSRSVCRGRMTVPMILVTGNRGGGGGADETATTEPGDHSHFLYGTDSTVFRFLSDHARTGRATLEL